MKPRTLASAAVLLLSAAAWGSREAGTAPALRTFDHVVHAAECGTGLPWYKPVPNYVAPPAELPDNPG